MEKEKYNQALTRADGFSDENYPALLRRQLVETRQSTKAVAALLKQVLPAETEIVYVKAKIASQFRQDFKLPKVREMNDLHHAKDAYLNIVVAMPTTLNLPPMPHGLLNRIRGAAIT